ncbi:serine carboxypeptidase S28-domain-containing protein [Multifurca ochricompacta]|uniref:Serine carboxypeptidase S28-domain-containing protein n=1 Tax=Multifurca ochricompacta TaxID=376703 RepID=A0AAD4LZZ0_9AGAM|nr:serine carboxypeptidase S28-domain-containing protein [Multifurca ochricompacta]
MTFGVRGSSCRGVAVRDREGMCMGVDGFSATECTPVNASDADAVLVTGGSRNVTCRLPRRRVGSYTFKQLIDHNNTSSGTFDQPYWAIWEFRFTNLVRWGAPKMKCPISHMPMTGGPIILMTPGESNADGFTGYLTNRTVNGQIAQQEKGAAIVLEHRFFGHSNPYPDLSVASFKYHTIQQAIDDLEYLANNVVLPFPVATRFHPRMLLGTHWRQLFRKPDVFWAGYASSAVVESIVDFWQYFEPERLTMPKNCSNDIQAVIAHWDQVIASGNTTAFDELKTSFGMGGVVHRTIAQPALELAGTESYLRRYAGKSAPASGWGVEHALSAWANYSSSTLPGLCSGQNIDDCLGTYNTSQSFWTDTSIDNANRSWLWIVCNQMGFLQESAPSGYPTLVSRLIQPIYDERQCQQMFPAAFSSPPVPDVEKTNNAYGGFYLKADRLFTATGLRDPWRFAIVSADGIDVQSTPEQPIVESDAFHCSDLITKNGLADPTVLNVQTQALKYIGDWLSTWEPPVVSVEVNVDLNFKHRAYPIPRR